MDDLAKVKDYKILNAMISANEFGGETQTLKILLPNGQELTITRTLNANGEVL